MVDVSRRRQCPCSPCLCCLHLDWSHHCTEPSNIIYPQREATCCTSLYPIKDCRKSKCWFSNASGMAVEARLTLHKTLNLTYSRRNALRAIHWNISPSHSTEKEVHYFCTSFSSMELRFSVINRSLTSNIY